MLGLILSPLGRILGAAVLALSLSALIYGAGWRAHASHSREEQFKAERDAALRDLAVAKTAAAAAELMADEADKKFEKSIKKADDYAKSLPRNGGCALTDSDIKQLRLIRGRKG